MTMKKMKLSTKPLGHTEKKGIVLDLSWYKL